MHARTRAGQAGNRPGLSNLPVNMASLGLGPVLINRGQFDNWEYSIEVIYSDFVENSAELQIERRTVES